MTNSVNGRRMDNSGGVFFGNVLAVFLLVRLKSGYS